MIESTIHHKGVNNDINKLYPEDKPIHEWYRFVLSFPPHLVRDYLENFGADENSLVYDPFCGTGTTLVEAKKLGIASVGTEANIMAYFASSTKTDWTPSPNGLLEHSQMIANQATEILDRDGIEDYSTLGPRETNINTLHTLSPESQKLLLAGSISPLPLHKAIVLLDCIERYKDNRYYNHERLAFAKSIVSTSSNLHFGPEVGVTKPKVDAPVIMPWLTNIKKMANDLIYVGKTSNVSSNIFQADSRDITQLVNNGIRFQSVDLVITSPPYPNEKDYTRTTRLESVLLHFINNKDEMQALKRGLLRSNTRNVYKGDDDDQDTYSAEIEQLAEQIEDRRIELNKTSGFEKLYGRVTKLYFGGMANHLEKLQPVLRPGAYLAYVVGDQASYLRVKIQTGKLLAQVAESSGYHVEGIELFRTRLSTVTKEQLREEVVILRVPGGHMNGKQYQIPLGWNESGDTGMSDDNILQASILDEQLGFETTSTEKKKDNSRYQQIMSKIFERHYSPGDTEFFFQRDELIQIAQELNIKVVLNLGDVMYSFRYRQQLPETIKQTAPENKEWVILPAGRSKYKFELREIYSLDPDKLIGVTLILDATPGIVIKYSQTDEQSLLTKLRYNRLIDIFMGITCYSLQNHLRTSIPSVGQIETDELYVGVDKWGAHYILPVQAKGGKDKLGIAQIEQDFLLCEHRYKNEKLIVIAIAAQFMEGDIIALMALSKKPDGKVEKIQEKHYRLVPPTDLSDEELTSYMKSAYRENVSR